MSVNDDRRCLVIDAHPIVRMGVRRLLAGEYHVEEAVDVRDALDVITALGEFDVAIVELKAGGGDPPRGPAAIRMLHKKKPTLGIVAHGPRPEVYAASEAIDAGAIAYVAKSSPPEALADAVAAAAEQERFVDPAARNGDGRTSLTRRQRETLQHYADGRSTGEVAKRLGVTTETVRTHAKAAIARLHARDRAHAVAIGLRSSLIE
jgi:DNA-binding NarL/FixJ family response regulator